MAGVFHLLGSEPLGVLSFPFKTVVLVVALVGALALNVAVLTVDKVFGLMSSAIELVATRVGIEGATVKSRRAAQLNSVQRERAALKRTVAAQKESLGDLKARNTRLRSELERPRTVSFRGQRRTIGGAVQETTERISHRIVNATALSTGSIAAESIPYLGIGVIVGLTALELHDACETIKDLHVLDLAFNPDAGNAPDYLEVCGTQVPSMDEIIASLKRAPTAAWDEAKDWMGPLKVPRLPTLDEARRSAWELWLSMRRVVASQDAPIE